MALVFVRRRFKVVKCGRLLDAHQGERVVDVEMLVVNIVVLGVVHARDRKPNPRVVQHS